MITFQREKLRDVRHEVDAIITRHWEEIALNKDDVPLDPRWDDYYALEDANMLVITTARQDGIIIGYCSHIMVPNLHYRSLRVADVDILYLDQPYRKGRLGLQLINAQEKNLIAAGANLILHKRKIHFHNPNGRGIEVALEALGYKPIEVLHAKRIK